MKFIAVKDFGRHQHYRDRRPIWIKLYVSLLEDYDFLALPEAAQSQLMKIWLLATRHDNRIPNQRAYIAGRIGAKRLFLAELIDAGFLIETDAEPEHSASKPLAEPEQNACLEKEIQEKERETTTLDPRARLERRLDEVALGLLDGLAETCGAEWPDIDRWLTRRPATNWQGWVRELAKLVGPGSQYTPADLAAAARDAELAEDPPRSAAAFRGFVAKAHRDRLEARRDPAMPRANGRRLDQREVVNEAVANALAVGQALGLPSRSTADAE